MRPQTLRLIGFRSYADATVDFRRHGLVVISGDTGAGKTSILDGICFALFAKTPELAGSRELLTLGASLGEVALTFSTAAGRWRVTRRFGPDAAEPAHVLERLDGADGVTERVTGAAAVNERVVALIGLTFQAFTSAVLLAQGRFAQFLQSTPKDRDAILRELFGLAGLEAVRSAALATRDAHTATAEALEAERAHLPAHAAGARNAAAREMRDATSRRAALERLRPLVAATQRAQVRASEAGAALAQIHGALDELGPPQDRALLAERHAATVTRAAEAREAHADALRALDDANAARDRLRERHGGTAAELSALRAHAERAAIAREAVPRERAQIDERRAELDARRADLMERDRLVAELEAAADRASGLAAAYAEYAPARELLTAARERTAAAQAARDAAEAEARRATDEADEADAAMDELRHAHLAARLRAELRPGEPCPVCGQDVAHPPPVPDDDLDEVEAGVAALQERAETLAAALSERVADLRAAREHERACRETADRLGDAVRAQGGSTELDDTAFAAAHADAERVVAAHATAQEDRAAVAAGIEREAGSIVEAERRLARDEAEVARLAAQLGDRAAEDDPAAALAAAVRDLELIEQAVVQSSRFTARTGERLAEVEAELREIEQHEVGAMRQSLVILATRLGVGAPEPSLGPAELIERAHELSLQAEWAAEDAAARSQAATSEVVRLRGELEEAGDPIGVGRPEDLEPALRAADEDLADARATIATIDRTVATAAGLGERAARARRQADVAAQLAQDLQANRFPRFLLGRFHRQLALGATSRLLALSHGAFSFTGAEPDHLAVVDHRRGNRIRSAATLSGGERFLASLALALSLADIASGAEGRLECLFLDEGFSSLDADSLELAIGGVERLADDGRLVVIITHLPGVAERLGAAIHVRKDPAGTSRIVDLSAVAG